jgi:hypothetical protein
MHLANEATDCRMKEIIVRGSLDSVKISNESLITVLGWFLDSDNTVSMRQKRLDSLRRASLVDAFRDS